MTDHRGSGVEGEEPPRLAGLVMRGSRSIGDTVRRTLVAIDRVTLMRCGLWRRWRSSSASCWRASRSRRISTASCLESLAAFFAALLFAGAVAWLLMWALVPTAEAPVNQAAVEALEALLAPTLRELEAVRADVVRKVKERSVIRAPIGAACAVLLWLVVQWGDDPPGLLRIDHVVRSRGPRRRRMGGREAGRGLHTALQGEGAAASGRPLRCSHLSPGVGPRRPQAGDIPHPRSIRYASRRMTRSSARIAVCRFGSWSSACTRDPATTEGTCSTVSWSTWYCRAV